MKDIDLKDAVEMAFDIKARLARYQHQRKAISGSYDFSQTRLCLGRSQKKALKHMPGLERFSPKQCAGSELWGVAVLWVSEEDHESIVEVVA